MYRLSPDVTAFLLKLNHDIAHGDAVPRLISDYETVAIQLDYAVDEDVVFRSLDGTPLLVADPCLAKHLEERPLVIKRQGQGYFLTLQDRRRMERMQLAAS